MLRVVLKATSKDGGVKAPIMGSECAAIWNPVSLYAVQSLAYWPTITCFQLWLETTSALFHEGFSSVWPKSLWLLHKIFCQPSLSAMPPLRISSPRDLNRIIPVQLSDLDELSILPKQSRWPVERQHPLTQGCCPSEGLQHMICFLWVCVEVCCSAHTYGGYVLSSVKGLP